MTTQAGAVHGTAASQERRVAQLARESDALMTAIREIHTLESEKRMVDISTPHFHELADRIVDKSRDVFRHAGEEADMDDDIATTGVTINEVTRGTTDRR